MVDPSSARSTTGPVSDKQKGDRQFVGFRLNDQQYAFRIEEIQEIVIPERITPTPQTPEYVDGVTNLRGEIIPIINLRRLFRLPARPIDRDTRTIVVNVGERTMGCLVDLVSQVIRIPQDAIQPAPETVTAGGADYIHGFAKLEDQLLIVLDVRALLDPERRRSSGAEPSTSAAHQDAPA